jgi:hypothetical protein
VRADVYESDADGSNYNLNEYFQKDNAVTASCPSPNGWEITGLAVDAAATCSHRPPSVITNSLVA